MKKITLILAFAVLAISVNAQTLNVQSAAEYLRKGYLAKAKSQIDPACENEKTKMDAKTWLYKGMIYLQMGLEVQKNPKSKLASSLPADWADQAFQAALECKRLDKNNEFADKNNQVFSALAESYYNLAYDAFAKEKDYVKAMQMADKVITINSNSGNKNLNVDAYDIAGKAAYNNRDTANTKKYFNLMILSKTKQFRTYEILFDIYMKEKDTVNAMKVVKFCSNNCPDDYNALVLTAKGYLMTGNLENSKEVLSQAQNMVKDKPAVYEQLLNQVAAIYEMTKDYAGAEAKYKESLALNPNQFGANFGLGSMFYNLAIEKFQEAEKAFNPDEVSDVYTLLEKEYKEHMSQAIPYLKAAIAYIEALTDQNQINANRRNHYECLKALRNCYTRLNMYDDVKGVNEKMKQIESLESAK